MTDEQQLAKYRTLKQQNLPFDFYEEEEQERKKQEQEQKAEEAKNKLNLPYYKEPRTDNEKLLNLQYEYKVNGNQKALDEMFKLAKKIAWKYINIKVKMSKKIKKLSTLDREIKAGDAASYLILQLTTRPTFYIKEYVTAYIYLRVIKEIYYHTKTDEIQDFVDFDRFYKEGTEEEISEWEERII